MLHPVLTVSAAVAMSLVATGVSHGPYFAQAFPRHVALGIVVVLLAVPLYRQFALIRAAGDTIALALVAGCLTALVSTLAYPVAIGAPDALLATLAPRSATTAVAVQVTEGLGGARR